MFLFYWLNIFPESYWNGFADGATVTTLFLFVKALSRYAHFCREYRSEFELIAFKSHIGDISVAEIDSFINKTKVNPTLPYKQQQRILAHLCLLRKYHKKWFQNYTKEQDSVISGMSKEKISPAALFFRFPAPFSHRCFFLS